METLHTEDTTVWDRPGEVVEGFIQRMGWLLHTWDGDHIDMFTSDRVSGLAIGDHVELNFPHCTFGGAVVWMRVSLEEHDGRTRDLIVADESLRECHPMRVGDVITFKLDPDDKDRVVGWVK